MASHSDEDVREFSFYFPCTGTAQAHLSWVYAFDAKFLLTEGSNGSVALTSDGIIIRRNCFRTNRTQLSDRIPFGRIHEVHLQPVGMLRAGSINFVLTGSQHSSTGHLQASEETGRIFFRRSEQKAFAQLAQFVRSIIRYKAAEERPFLCW